MILPSKLFQRHRELFLASEELAYFFKQSLVGRLRIEQNVILALQGYEASTRNF